MLAIVYKREDEPADTQRIRECAEAYVESQGHVTVECVEVFNEVVLFYVMIPAHVDHRNETKFLEGFRAYLRANT